MHDAQNAKKNLIPKHKLKLNLSKVEEAKQWSKNFKDKNPINIDSTDRKDRSLYSDLPSSRKAMSKINSFTPNSGQRPNFTFPKSSPRANVSGKLSFKPIELPTNVDPQYAPVINFPTINKNRVKPSLNFSRYRNQILQEGGLPKW